MKNYVKINQIGIIMSVLNFIVLLIFSVSSEASVSDNRYVNITQFDVYDGIAGNKVTHIDQDNQGYMWFSTHGGLSRFDSQDFLNYKQDTLASNTLPSNEVSLFHLVDNEMWISLNGVGLARFNLQDQQFTMVPETPDEPSGIEHSVVFSVTSDQDQNVWIFQFDHGISVFEKDTKTFTHYNLDNTDWLTSVRFFDAKMDRQGFIWVATLEGQIIKIDPRNRTAQTFLIESTSDDFKSSRIYAVSITPDNRIYASGYMGVYQFDEHSDQFKLIISTEHIAALMGEQLAVRSITYDSKGNLWLATKSGLLLFKDNQLTQIKFLEKGKPVLTDFNVKMVFEDSEQNIWLATDENGAVKLNPGWDQINVYLPFSNPQLAGNEIINVLSDHSSIEDTFWVLNQGDGHFLAFRYQNGRINQNQVYDERHGMPNDVLDMYQDSDYRMWISSTSGLYVFDLSENKFVAIESPEIQGGIKGIFESADELYLSVYGERQLYSVNKNTLHISKLDQYLLNDVHNSSVKDFEGNFWVIGNRGLELFKSDTKTFETIVESNEGFNDIWLDNENTYMWLIANGKLLKYEIVDDQIIADDTSEINAQISKDFVDSIEVIDGQLWLGSNNGVIVVDPENDQVVHRFTVGNNLPSNYILGVLPLYDGSKMVFTDAGIAHIQKMLSVDKLKPSNLILEKTLLNGNVLNGMSELPYNYGSLTVAYQLLSFSEPDSHQYQYRLNEQSNWDDSDHQNKQTFHQLLPGKYQFAVRGKSKDGVWSTPVTFDFQVLAPPWKSTLAYWIYVFSALLLMALMVVLYRKRWQYNAKISQAKEKQAFAEAQLSLTTSLVTSLETDQLLDKIKQQIKAKITADEVEVCYWNSLNNYQIFSDSNLSKIERNELGAKALDMFERQQSHVLENNANGSNLWVMFSHSSERLGLVNVFRKQGFFNQTDISLAKAYATQSSLALENARLFEEVNHLAEQANASNRAKSDFLAQVSHEVRTPMNGILGMNELLLDTELNEEQRLYASAVAESGAHLLHIINDILDLSKIEAGELILESRSVNLLSLIDEIIKGFVSSCKNHKLQFWIDVSADVNPMRMADAVRLKQIIMNLLSNAFKFTALGEVTLSLKPSKQDDWLAFSVKDTGIGIEPTLIDKLFDPFTQADSSVTRKYGGTGLGLTIVKQLTEKMGGYIEIHSVPNEGTEVICCMPLAIEKEANSVKHERQRVKILGQHSGMVQALKNCLSFCGVETTEADENWDALFVFDESNSDYSEAINTANRNLIPVYLLKLCANQGIQQQGTFRVLDIPYTFSSIKQLFKTKSDAMYCEVQSRRTAKKRHILVVEDNPINQQLLLELLEKEGHLVDIFDDASQALAGIEKSTYDLFLVDYHLPDLTGVEFILSCRQSNITTTAIIMTADVSESLNEQCRAHNIAHLITKPFKMNDLTAIIDSI